jgi:hypothetical protein
MSGTSPGLQNTLEQAKQTRLNAKKSFPHGLGQFRSLDGSPQIVDKSVDKKSLTGDNPAKRISTVHAHEHSWAS